MDLIGIAGDALTRFALDPDVERVAVVLAAAVTLGPALGYAYRLRKTLVSEGITRRRGRKAKDPAVQKAKDDAHLNQQLRHRALIAMWVAFWGLTLPSVYLLLLLMKPDLIEPNAVVFVSSIDDAPVLHPSMLQLAAFVLNQLVRGATADFIELFRIPIGSLATSPEALSINLVIMLFRFVIQGVEAVVIANVIWPWLDPKRGLKTEVKQVQQPSV